MMLGWHSWARANILFNYQKLLQSSNKWGVFGFMGLRMLLTHSLKESNHNDWNAKQ
jgi:hypothetical protein